MIKQVLYDKKKGQRVPVKIWASNIEAVAIDQLIQTSKLPFVFKHVAAMPDAHWGKGATIGSVIPCEDVIIPSAVGVDIGCGMCALQTPFKKDQFDDALKEKLYNEIHRVIPVGYSHHQEPSVHWRAFSKEVVKDGTCDKDKNSILAIELFTKEASRQLGTLGGGNHFIELQYDTDDNVWIMIHSGSRNMGYRVAALHMTIAKQFIQNWKIQYIPNDLEYLPVSTEEGMTYLGDMNLALRFALENRKAMMLEVVGVLNRNMKTNFGISDMINIHHNYTAIENHYGKNVWVHRKGATLARDNTIGIIPGSMGTHSYIVKGKGNPESFMSCSHGAGRRMSRTQAKKTIDMKDFQHVMKGIKAPVKEKTLDEAPQAYKSITTVMKDQEDLVDIQVKLKPMMVIKG